MSANCELVNKFALDPDGLIEFCREVIGQVESVGTDKTVEKQFKAIEASVKMLEKQGIPVPDALRQEKVRLGVELEDRGRTEWRQKLCRLADGLDDVVKVLRHKYGDKKPRQSIGVKKTSKKRARGPALLHTPKERLRELMVGVLKQYGGAAKPKDVVSEISNKVGGKWFPGDLVLRKDGRTVAWVNNVHWEAARMKQEGVLKTDRATGLWTLVEE